MERKLISRIKVPTKYLDPRDRQSIGYKKKLHHEQLHDFYGCHNYYNQVTLFYNQLDIKVIW